MELPLVDKHYLLEKFEGKGGWTFARIPEILKDKKAPFGWVKVKGTIDGFAINNYHLMPMGDGQLFLSVKAQIRKIIGKQAGDTVRIVLYPDYGAIEIPDEFLMCLQDEPKAHKFFFSLTESEKKYYIQWVYTAKKEETRITRLATAINRLQNGMKMYDKAGE